MVFFVGLAVVLGLTVRFAVVLGLVTVFVVFGLTSFVFISAIRSNLS